MLRIFPIFLLVALMLCVSTPSFGQGSYGRAKQSSYICQLGGAVWNQSKPCNQVTSERETMLKRIDYEGTRKRQQEMAEILERHEAEATLAQLRNFPEKLVGQDVVLSDVWMSGNITRSNKFGMQEGQQSVVVFQDKNGRKISVAANDHQAMRLLEKLHPDRIYPVAQALVTVQQMTRGYAVVLKNYTFSDAPSKPTKADLNEKPSPILDYGQAEESKDQGAAAPEAEDQVVHIASINEERQAQAAEEALHPQGEEQGKESAGDSSPESTQAMGEMMKKMFGAGMGNAAGTQKSALGAD